MTEKEEPELVEPTNWVKTLEESFGDEQQPPEPWWRVALARVQAMARAALRRARNVMRPTWFARKPPAEHSDWLEERFFEIEEQPPEPRWRAGLARAKAAAWAALRPAGALAVLSLPFLLAGGIVWKMHTLEAEFDGMIGKSRSDAVTALVWANSRRFIPGRGDLYDKPENFVLAGTRSGRILVLPVEGRRGLLARLGLDSMVVDPRKPRGAVVGLHYTESQWNAFFARSGVEALWRDNRGVFTDDHPAPRGLAAIDGNNRVLVLADDDASQRVEEAAKIALKKDFAKRAPAERAKAIVVRALTGARVRLHQLNAQNPQDIDLSKPFGAATPIGVHAIPADASFLVLADNGQVAKIAMETSETTTSAATYAYNYGYRHPAPVVAFAAATGAGRGGRTLAATAASDGSIRLLAGSTRAPSRDPGAFPVDRFGPIAPDGLALSADGGVLMLRTQMGRVFARATDVDHAPWWQIELSPPKRVAWPWIAPARAEMAAQRPVADTPPLTKGGSANDPLSHVKFLGRPPPRIPATAAVLTPDGKNAVIAGEDGLIRLVAIDEPGKHRLRATIRGHGDVLTHLAVSPDGRYLASASLDGRLRVTDLVAAADWDGWPLFELPAEPEAPTSPDTPATASDAPQPPPPAKAKAN